MKTILVIRSSAMGDVAMTAPVLRALSERYGEQVKVVMLTREFYEPFFEGISGLEIFNIDLAEQHNGVRGVYRLFCQLQQAYRLDMVIDLNYKLYSRLLRNFFRLAGIKTYHIDKGRAEKKMITRNKNKHLVQLKSSIERYADVFRVAGLPIQVPNILPPRAVRAVPAMAGPKGERWVGIAPFAKHQGKVLPMATIRLVIEQLTAWDPTIRIFIFGGGRAEKMVARSLEAWYSNCTSVIGALTLEGEMDMIASLDVMLSMDSSAMHMSSLLGVRVVSVWGATHPYAGFLGLGQSLSDVVQVDSLPCRPCSVYGHKPCMRGDWACMQQITPEVIVSRLVSLLW
ncbi:MAG: glycosyltransferase family 9 protein [Mucinivorans sp.]